MPNTDVSLELQLC